MTGRAPDAATRLAAALSFWWPGLGQLYRRQWGSGLALMTASALASAGLGAAWPYDLLRSCRWPDHPLRAATYAVALVALSICAVRDAGR